MQNQRYFRSKNWTNLEDPETFVSEIFFDSSEIKPVTYETYRSSGRDENTESSYKYNDEKRYSDNLLFFFSTYAAITSSTK